MANIPENIKFLMLKWRAGSLTEAERSLLDAWYEQELPEELYWYGETEEMLKGRMLHAVETAVNEDFSAEPHKGRYRKLVWSVTAAAAVLLLFFFAYPYLGLNEGRVDAVLAEHKVGQEVTKVILPDQSIVWLKGNSTLTYPKTFAGKTREVELIGEALFEISKDKSKPFIIRSGDYTTQVLGTSFNLKVDRQTGELNLDVLTGKVEVAKKSKGMVVAKKYVVTANSSLHTLTDVAAKSVEIRPVTTIGELTKGTEYDMNFVSQPVEDIMKRFEEKFNVTFEGYTGEYRSCNVTADLTDQSLETSLKLLSLSINATYKIKDQTIRLTGGGCF